MTAPKWTKLDEYKIWLEELATSLEAKVEEDIGLALATVYIAIANEVRMALNRLETILDETE